MAADQRMDQYLEDRLRRLNEIGVALSVERDLHALLDRILLEARRFTHADAGTLYLRSGDELIFENAQNDTLRIFTGGSQNKADVPPVPITRDSVSGYATVTGRPLNIADVYDEDGEFRFEGPKQYDQMTGYRTTSMLVVPMKDHEDQVIGVLQLINATQPDSGQVIPFTAEDEALLQSLASQAGVAITNVRLIEDTERLFESFLQVMATAIDERSPYTGGHIRRVAEVTMHVAEAVNACQEGPLASVSLTKEELNELRIAAWMHDIGKITTPEWVVDKPTKLTTIADRIELVRTRFQLLRKSVEAEMLRREAALATSGEQMQVSERAEYERRMEQVDEDLAFLERVNSPTEFMEDSDLERLEAIAVRDYVPEVQSDGPTLSENELFNLSIRKGNLTNEEFQKIKDHASMTLKMLGQIPFTRKLRRVPEIAGAHHEKLDGSGYPQGLSADQISLQARILALIDIFESLSADDRPYRAKPMSRELVLRILNEEVDYLHLDGDLLELFVRNELYTRLDELKSQEQKQTGDGAAGSPADS
ncbi:HD domain-containing phosphohydrolase [Candidatus Latescibacterota bacterium]